MVDEHYAIGVITVMTLVTFGLRALPFLAARWLQRMRFVQELGQFLPLAIMTLLLVHSLAGASRQHVSGPWPEALSVALVVGLQWKVRNALLSIFAGTTLYVLIRNA